MKACIEAVTRGLSWILVFAVSGMTQGVGAQDVVEASLRLQVASAWGAEAEHVWLRLSEGWPAGVDSARVEPSRSNRWLATIYTEESVIRRFVQVGHQALVSVAARELQRGETVAADVIEVRRTPVAGPPRHRESVDGWVAQRTIQAGEVLAEPAVRPGHVIRGGDQVEAQLNTGQIQLVLRAQALNSGRAKDVVRVRLPSGREFQALAQSPGLVILILGDF
jgi:flagella basal body P-ring formation protein FlgA